MIAGAGVYLAYNHTSKTIQSPAASAGVNRFPLSYLKLLLHKQVRHRDRVSLSRRTSQPLETVNVTGLGFTPSSLVPVGWSTRVGNNLNGFTIRNKPLKNVTSSALGSFTFTTKVPCSS